MKLAIKSAFGAHRRVFLAGGVAGAAVAAYGGAFTAGAVSSCGPSSDESLDALYAVGSQYLRAIGADGRLPLERQAAALSRAGGPLAPDALAVVLAGLAERTKADFAAGRTVDCDGWVLARSEVEVCAVLALAAGRADPEFAIV